jgi:hypothetical protein
MFRPQSFLMYFAPSAANVPPTEPKQDITKLTVERSQYPVMIPSAVQETLIRHAAK